MLKGAFSLCYVFFYVESYSEIHFWPEVQIDKVGPDSIERVISYSDKWSRARTSDGFYIDKYMN